MNFAIDELIVMQESLRNQTQIPEMVQFVQSGGFWTNDILQEYAKIKGIKKCPLMEIVEFPDGKRFVHDGHHRAVSIYLGGRKYIRDDEFVLKKWDYTNYQSINFVNHWVTPFNPVDEVRVADFYEFKKKAIELLKIDELKATKFILENKQVYVRPRIVWGISDLANKIEKKNAY